MSRKYILSLLILISLTSYAQQSVPGQPIICFSSGKNEAVHVGRSTSNLRQATTAEAFSTFEITYSGFSEDAKKAFQFAIDIWSTELHSNIPIRITALWTPLQGNSLATTRATKLYRGFKGAVRSDVWYPVSLAEKISDQELNETTESDIEISLNANTNWYFGTDNNPSSGTIDMVTIALHEIAHGLGFSSSANVKDNKGYLRDENYLSIYDLILENSNRVRLSAFGDPSAKLQTELTSNAVFLFSPLSSKLNSQYPKIFAPSFFIAGSSISHLDESEYPPGDLNALMSPYFSSSESIHSLGNILPAVLSDMGWGDLPTEPYKASVYPNPSNGKYRLEMQMPVSFNSVELSILDATGRAILTKTIFVDEYQIDLSLWPNGLYMLCVKTPETTIVKKIVLLK